MPLLWAIAEYDEVIHKVTINCFVRTSRLLAMTLDTVNKAYLIDELMDFLAKINKIFAGIVYLFQKNLIICSKKKLYSPTK